MVMVWEPGQMKCLPGLVHLQMKWDRVCHPLSQWGEVSPDFDQRIGVQRWGQKTVCEAQLWVLNGTWVEEAEVNAQECMTFCGRTMDWHSLCISALFCSCQMGYHTCAISRICH